MIYLRMRLLKSPASLFLWIFALISLLTASPAYAARKVDSYEKLELLRRATGSDEPVRNGFEARLNTILNPTADAEQSYIAEQDLAARIETQNKQQEDAMLRSEVQTSVSKPTNENAGPVKSIDDTRVRGFVDNSEEGFQKSLKLAEEKEKKKEKEEPEASKAKSTKPSDQDSKLAPSLANNPFYRKPAEETNLEKRFELMKPVILSRLAIIGMDESQAQAVVERATSPEDIVISLMQDPDMTYAAVQEIVLVTDDQIS